MNNIKSQLLDELITNREDVDGELLGLTEKALDLYQTAWIMQSRIIYFYLFPDSETLHSPFPPPLTIGKRFYKDIATAIKNPPHKDKKIREMALLFNDKTPEQLLETAERFGLPFIGKRLSEQEIRERTDEDHEIDKECLKEFSKITETRLRNCRLSDLSFFRLLLKVNVMLGRMFILTSPKRVRQNLTLDTKKTFFHFLKISY